MDSQQQTQDRTNNPTSHDGAPLSSSRRVRQEDTPATAATSAPNAISRTTAPLAPPAPHDLVVGAASSAATATTSFNHNNSRHHRHLLAGRSRSWCNETDLSFHEDGYDDEDDAVMRHTPCMTRFTPLPDCTFLTSKLLLSFCDVSFCNEVSHSALCTT